MTIQTEDLREQVARIVDPKAWRDWDRCGAFPLRTDDSLAKADAILALVSSTKGGGDQENLGDEPYTDASVRDCPAADGWLPIVLCPTDGEWRLVKLADGREFVASFDGSMLGARRWRSKSFGYHNPQRPTGEMYGGIERLTHAYDTLVIADLPEPPQAFRPNDTVHGAPKIKESDRG